MEVELRENRSWVGPLSFLAFGGILIGGIFSFLWAQDLLLTERGSALVAWLTLIVTTLALLAAAFAVYYALKQSKATEVQLANIKRERIEEKIRSIANFGKYYWSMYDNILEVSMYIMTNQPIDNNYNDKIRNTIRLREEVMIIVQNIGENVFEEIKEDMEKHRNVVGSIIRIGSNQEEYDDVNIIVDKKINEVEELTTKIRVKAQSIIDHIRATELQNVPVHD